MIVFKARLLSSVDLSVTDPHEQVTGKPTHSHRIKETY
jgi:hypothetical protein